MHPAPSPHTHTQIYNTFNNSCILPPISPQGGGFSAQFQQEPHAKWQVSAVASYLSTVNASTLPPAGSFPPMGRATPDVSALGEGYQVIVSGRTGSVGGTSASCPAFAAIVSLLNEARLDAGKPAMGFLNPFLYANPDAFTDITKGSNKISRGGYPLRYGFDCAKGWDPATGLGTPKFDKLLAAAMAGVERRCPPLDTQCEKDLLPHLH